MCSDLAEPLKPVLFPLQSCWAPSNGNEALLIAQLLYCASSNQVWKPRLSMEGRERTGSRSPEARTLGLGEQQGTSSSVCGEIGRAHV